MLEGLTRIAIGRHPRKTLIRAAVLAVVCFLFFRYVARPIWADGSSMEPTVPNQSLHWASEALLWFQPIEFGDIVVISRNNRERFLKRVVGLPGDTVEFRDGLLWLDGQPVEEPYLVHRAHWNREPRALGPNEYFVVGDNRGVPMETHLMGVTRRRYIRGKFLF